MNRNPHNKIWFFVLFLRKTANLCSFILIVVMKAECSINRLVIAPIWLMQLFRLLFKLQIAVVLIFFFVVWNLCRRPGISCWGYWRVWRNKCSWKRITSSCWAYGWHDFYPDGCAAEANGVFSWFSGTYVCSMECSFWTNISFAGESTL